MRIARTLLIAALIALAALALAASASAESTEVHVEREPLSGPHEPCDPCYIHAQGEEETEFESALAHGVVITQCHDELEGEINEDGEGHVHLTELEDGPSANCNVTPCEGVEAEWPIHLREISDQERIALRFCLRSAAGVPVHCDFEVDLEDLGTHDWMIRADNATCSNGVPIAITGEWHLEQYEHDNLEIDHLRD